MGTSAEAGALPDDGRSQEPVQSERPFVVRPARPRDAASFVELWKAVAAEGRFIRTERIDRSVRYYRRRFFKRTMGGEQATLVAVLGDRVIGHIHVAREDSPWTRHVASLGMTVAADWRGRGVGSALMAEVIGWAKSVGVEKLALSVYPDNEAARALYAKFGFQEEGRLTGHSKKSIGYRDEIVMGLWLIPQPPSDP
jgi:L-phenylalanine/L-methionine N-acetyltransferase